MLDFVSLPDFSFAHNLFCVELLRCAPSSSKTKSPVYQLCSALDRHSYDGPVTHRTHSQCKYTH